MKNTSRFLGPAALGLACLLAEGLARAQDATPPAASATPPAQSTGASCEASYEKAQTDRLAGHYVSAQAAALACSQIQCNQAIVRECLRLYESLQEDTPTLVFSARKAEGGELIDVKVEMDGKQILDGITGRPFPVDPGPHQFAFIDPTRGRQETTESARVGDHARVVEVTFPDPNAKLPPATTPGAPGADHPVAAHKKPAIPVMTFVLGGVGVVGLASFAYFRLSGVGDYNHYNATCSPYCNPNDIDGVRTKFLLSYISLGVGIAGAAGAGLVYVLNHGGSEGAQTEASLEPLGGGGALARVRTRF
ncbi:MAG TPA: hypothetical protein VMI54_13615 [Polyangiaceae bacterium]|nr:hypothetical protein [Polyangiaceae bacterium]